MMLFGGQTTVYMYEYLPFLSIALYSGSTSSALRGSPLRNGTKQDVRVREKVVQFKNWTNRTSGYDPAKLERIHAWS